MKIHQIKVLIIISLRLTLGWIFFWAFLDKLLGLGYATTPENAWMNGGSPTEYFLSQISYGPLSSFYQSIAGHPLVDTLFMAGRGLVGLCLMLGVGLKIAGYSGAAMVLFMWSSMLPPANNPFIDEHIVYAILFVGIAHSDAGTHFGLGNRWMRTSLVKRHPWLA